MRKTLAVVSAVSVLAVVLVAGSALAHGGMWDKGYGGFGCDGPRYMSRSADDNYGPSMKRGSRSFRTDRSRNERWQNTEANTRGFRSQEMPEELRGNFTEMRKINLEIRREMLEEKPDVEKLTELHEKMKELRNEMHDWHFQNYLKNFKSSEESD